MRLPPRRCSTPLSALPWEISIKFTLCHMRLTDERRDEVRKIICLLALLWRQHDTFIAQYINWRYQFCLSRKSCASLCKECEEIMAHLFKQNQITSISLGWILLIWQMSFQGRNNAPHQERLHNDKKKASCQGSQIWIGKRASILQNRSDMTNSDSMHKLVSQRENRSTLIRVVQEYIPKKYLTNTPQS